MKKFPPVKRDKESGLPKKYVAGLSKSTAKARAAHWKKTSKMSDSDPRSYEPAPGDATAKTKPSKYTKRFHKMFGEQIGIVIEGAPEKIEGTNCANCIHWVKESEKPVDKSELNEYGGLKAPNEAYIEMSKHADLVTLPGKAVVKIKAYCNHEDIHDFVTERMCCAYWDGEGVKREYKGISPKMDESVELDETIVKVRGKFRLVSKKTGRNLGTYDTKAGAMKRERQVQYFKHMGEEKMAEYKPKVGDRISTIKGGQNTGKVEKVEGGHVYFRSDYKRNELGGREYAPLLKTHVSNVRLHEKVESVNEDQAADMQKIQSMDKGSMVGGKTELKTHLKYLNAMHTHQKKYGLDTAKTKKKIGDVSRSLVQMGEEVEQVDEMDKSQASSSRGAEGLALGKKADPVKTDKVKSDALKLLQKQYKKVKEEVEQIDELDQKTLKSYIKKNVDSKAYEKSANRDAGLERATTKVARSQATSTLKNKVSKLRYTPMNKHKNPYEYQNSRDELANRKVSEEVEQVDEAVLAPFPGEKWKDHAVMVKDKQRIVIHRKNIKNYPEHEGWKEVAPGMKQKNEEVEQFEGFLSFLRKKPVAKKPTASHQQMRATFKKLERQTSIAKPQQTGPVIHRHTVAAYESVEQIDERNKANAEAKKRVLRTAGVNAAISGKVPFTGSALQMGRKAAKKLPSKGLAKAYRELPRVAEEEVKEGKADTSLAAKARKSGISLGTLRKVYNRGVAAWNSGHRPGTTPQQWGHARVNSYITKGKTYHTADKDLRRESVDVNEAFEREFGDK